MRQSIFGVGIGALALALALPASAQTTSKLCVYIPGTGGCQDVSASNPLPVTGGGGGGGGNVTIVNGSNVAAVSAAGALKVDGSASTQPISGTVGVSSLPALPAGANSIGTIGNTGFAATQSGTWTVQPGNTANTTAWLVNGNVGGFTVTPAASFNRPANTTAYASGQLVANSTVAGSVTPLSLVLARTNAGSGMVRRVRLQTSATTLTNGTFRVHFYGASPTVSNGDGAAWLSNGAAGYLGSFDVTLDKAFTDGADGQGVPSVGSEVNFVAGAGVTTLWVLLEARAAYVPTSGGTFTVTAEAIQN